MKRGLSKLFAIARDLARYVCPLCEKITPENEAKVRRRYKRWARFALHDGHWLWTCRHCGATHREGRESLIK